MMAECDAEYNKAKKIEKAIKENLTKRTELLINSKDVSAVRHF
jgi:hypothetical protein